MSDDMLIEYCSPTLAGIKTANLFTCDCDDKYQLMKDLSRVNGILERKGIKAIPIRYSDHRVLIYVYRQSFLEKDFCDKDTSLILSKLGYEVKSVASCLKCLSDKLFNLKSSRDFPHEIGLFLGYPVDDVMGFIRHKGEHSRYTGVWKVYGDVESAKHTFDKYDKCTRDYKLRFERGTSLDSLAVKA